MHDVAVPVEVAHERNDSALEVERHFAVTPLVDEREFQIAREIGGFTKPLNELIEVVVQPGDEDFLVGKKRRRGAMIAIGGLSHDLHRPSWNSSPVLLAGNLAIAAHVDTAPLRERVHHRGADAEQATPD